VKDNNPQDRDALEDIQPAEAGCAGQFPGIRLLDATGRIDDGHAISLPQAEAVLGAPISNGRIAGCSPVFLKSLLNQYPDGISSGCISGLGP
jgi:hypothetical protein